MSGTELSRLMAEVTEHPPVDVEFGAVETKVHRRQSRLHAAAGTAAVLAVGAIIAVPTIWAGSAGDGNRASTSHPSTPPVVEPDTSWGHEHWGPISWRTPAGWLPSAAYPDHPRINNARVEGPYLGTTRLPQSSPTPRPVQGNGVLGSAGPTLAPDAVVAWFTYGSRADGLSTDFSEAPPYLKARCTAMGAPHLFHEARQFGSASHGSNLSLDGCISAADPAAFSAQLSAILASAKDSTYPAAVLTASAVPSSRPTPTSSGSARVTPTFPVAIASNVASGGSAAALCGSALGSYETAELTTVGDVRTANWGPPVIDARGKLVGRMPHAFPGAKASDPAAWCWTRPARAIYDIYAVHAGDRPAFAISIAGVTYAPGQVPSGPPNVP